MVFDDVSSPAGAEDSARESEIEREKLIEKSGEEVY